MLFDAATARAAKETKGDFNLVFTPISRSFLPHPCHHTPTLFLSRPVGLSIRETRISFCYGKFLIKLAAYGVVVVPPLRNDDIVDGETVMPASDTPTITPPEPVFNLTIHRASYHVEAATGPGHYSNYMSLSAAAFSRMWSGLSGLRSWPLSLSIVTGDWCL